MRLDLQQYHYLWSLVSLQPQPLILSYAPPIVHQMYIIGGDGTQKGANAIYEVTPVNPCVFHFNIINLEENT